MLIFFILLLTLPLFAVKKRTENSGEILNSYSTTCIKGVLCLFVAFHNLGLDYKGNSQIMELICEHAGGVGVGLFFFLSAFGIIRSYQKKGNNYLLRLIFIHVLKIYLISVAINLLIYLVYFKGGLTKTDLLLKLFNLDLFNDFNRMNRHGWYIPTIIAMYLIFALVYFVCSKLKTPNKFIIAGIIVSVIAVGLRITAQIADKGGMYTREITAFATGAIYATFYDKFNEFFKKYFTPAFVICFIAFWVGFFLFEPVATHAAALLIIILSQKITYESKVTFFLGKICLGVYLFLYFSTLTLQTFVNNPYLWMLLNTAFILELSVILYGITYFIESIIKKAVARFKAKNVLSSK